jgi:hypothetical protein
MTAKRNVALKLDEATYAQVGVLAKLHGHALPDELRQAVTDHLERQRSELAERSAEVLADIEREAAARRSAIESLLGPTAAPAPKAWGGKAAEPAT